MNDQCDYCRRDGMIYVLQEVGITNGLTLTLCDDCQEQHIRVTNFYRHDCTPEESTRQTIDGFYGMSPTEWQDDDCDSEHNDHCPNCDAEIEPYKSEWREVE